MASILELLIIGPGLSVRLIVSVSEHPLASVIVTVYEPAKRSLKTSGELALLCVKSPVISNGPVPSDQLRVIEPLASEQIVLTVFVDKSGPGISVNVVEATEVHPLASVTVTVYEPASKLEKVSGELALVNVKSPVTLYGPKPPIHVN